MASDSDVESLSNEDVEILLQCAERFKISDDCLRSYQAEIEKVENDYQTLKRKYDEVKKMFAKYKNIELRDASVLYQHAWMAFNKRLEEDRNDNEENNPDDKKKCFKVCKVLKI